MHKQTPTHFPYGWVEQFIDGNQMYSCDFCKALYPPKACPFNDVNHGADKPYNHPSRFRGCASCKYAHSLGAAHYVSQLSLIQEERLQLWNEIYKAVDFTAIPCLNCPSRTKCLTVSV